MVKNYDILLSIYYNDYNIITDKKKMILKNMILKAYLLKVKDLINQRKKIKKKVNYSQTSNIEKTKAR